MRLKLAVAVTLAWPGVAAGADGVVQDGGARFQVLSPTLVRLEYAADGLFEDRPTMLAFNRRVDAPRFTSAVEGDRRVIRTDRLSIFYTRGSGAFTAENLEVAVQGGGVSARAVPRWRSAQYSPPPGGLGPLGYFGAKPDRSGPRTSGNLGGWARGLDSQSEARVLRDGLISRDGWSFVDDSHSVVLVDEGRRFERRPAHEGAYQDGYVFAYGHDYAAALADYRLLSGPAPLLPRKAFGVWFSRYFPYSEDDYRKRLVPAFRRERVPLDVLMVDTDFKSPQRWNGWNWRRDLFPDPKRFLDWAHGERLEVGLNSHPSIARSDPRFADADRRAGGLIPGALGPAVSGGLADPAALAELYYTFDLADPRHLDSYFSLHEPFERDGADFWWHDWCCEEARVGPLIPDGTLSGDAWINSHYARRNAARGTRWLSLARMGGSFEDWTGDRPGPWGEQRSTIHFTGDAVSTWAMLDFQTRFTVAEGNVGLPYVSHDIGGFQGDRLYSVARESHDAGLPMARGMYLTWPQHDEAYRHDRQYMLGSQLLVAPVASPGDPAVKRVWFPPGRWVDIFTGERHAGPVVETLRVGLGRMPVFARAGGIVPRQPYADASTHAPPRVLELDVFAGRGGAFSLYEDAGDGFAYRDGRFARTALRWNQSRRTLTIGGSRGRYGGQPRRRTYRVRFVGVNRPRRVRGAARWAYDASTRTLTARTRSVRAADRLRVVLVA